MKHVGRNAYIIRDKDNSPVLIRGQQALGVDIFDGEIKDFSDAEQSFLAVASRESVDRMGDIIMVKGWQLENYRKNPVVMPFHDYRALPVGRSLEEFVKGKNLMFRPQFAPYDISTTMYSMYRDKYLKGFSVGFVPKKEEPIKNEEEDKDEKKSFFQPTRYIEQELLEVSVAPVPAHPDALAEIKTMVQKNQLWIPAKYLLEEEASEVEIYDEYIHVIEACKGKFVALYIIEVEPGILVVYGQRKEEDETLYFNQRFIFDREMFNAEGAMTWAKDNKTKIDIFEDEGNITLSTPSIARQIELIPYEPDKYESKEPVLIDALPVCDPDVFGDCEEVEIEIEEEAEVEGEELALDQIERPYPNEHSCRLQDPGKYDKFRRNNCYRKSDGKCIDYIFGIKGDKSEVQAMRYPKDIWTASAARAHCKDKGGTFEAAGESSLEEQMMELEERVDAMHEFWKEFMKEWKEFLEKQKPELEEEVELEIEPEPEEVELEIEEEAETQTLELELDVENDEAAKDVIKKAVRANLGQLD